MELARYKRNIQLPEIGEVGQKLLLKSSVFLVGCGAVGSVTASYLSAMGIGHIGICDFDSLDISNLQRQVFYHTDEVGREKVILLESHLSRLNPDCKVEIIRNRLTEENADSIFRKFDYVIDCSDNPATKKTISLSCVRLNKPYSIGGVNGFKGQVFSFRNHNINYCDIFNLYECEVSTADLSKGVFGPTPGVVGSILASEALGFLSDSGLAKENSILDFDLATMDFKKIIL